MLFQKNNRTLKKYILTCIFIFSMLTIIFLWFFLFSLMEPFYEVFKKFEIDNIEKDLINNINDDNFEDVIKKTAYLRCIDIEVINNGKSIANNHNIFIDNADYQKIKKDFMESNQANKSYKLVDNDVFNKVLLVSSYKINNSTYSFIIADIVPLTSTRYVLMGQISLVTLVIIIFTWIVAPLLSKKISSPIEGITETVRKILDGNYKVVFNDKSNIEEIDELAYTLNKAANELVNIEQLRMDLMSNVSHDLKTPLTMIKAHAEMIKDITYKDKEKMNDNLNTIIEETDRLSILVDDILTLSKLEAINDINVSEFDLIEMIESILKRYSVLEITENYKFIFNKEKKHLLVNADYKKLEQVIYNLINNAINYAGNDNEVIINVIDNKDTVKVEIQDHGKGIKKDEIAFIWNKYYKSNKKHKRNAIGTGLGLNIVRTILVQHNFKYGVKSTVNKGTTFYFYIKKKSN